MKTKLQQAGDSVTVAIPQNLFDKLSLETGAAVTLVVHQGCLIVDPHLNPRPRYTIAELLAESDYPKGQPE